MPGWFLAFLALTKGIVAPWNKIAVTQFSLQSKFQTLRGTKGGKVYETGVSLMSVYEVSFSQPHAFDVSNDGRGKLAVGSKWMVYLTYKFAEAWRPSASLSSAEFWNVR